MGVWADKIKKTAEKPEVYSATEGRPIPATQGVTPTDLRKSAMRRRVNPPAQRKATLATRTKIASDQATASPPSQSSLEATFDPVPEGKRELILERLQLIERLVRIHGRAYDYRVLTNQKLKRILDELEPASADTAESAPETAPLPPPVIRPSKVTEVATKAPTAEEPGDDEAEEEDEGEAEEESPEFDFSESG